MSERFAAWIEIGGTLPRSKVHVLLDAIEHDGVSLEWGDALFKPRSGDDLMTARKEGHLWLCDDSAAWGQLPEVEQACRKLRLSFTRCCDGNCSYDGERVDWRPGMKEPLHRRSSTESPNESFVQTCEVKRALTMLETGDAPKTLALLRKLCPDIPELPPFEIA